MLFRETFRKIKKKKKRKRKQRKTHLFLIILSEINYLLNHEDTQNLKFFVHFLHLQIFES